MWQVSSRIHRMESSSAAIAGKVEVSLNKIIPGAQEILDINRPILTANIVRE